MKIAIDISQVVYEGTGVARFTEKFVTSLAHNPKMKGHKICLFFSSLNHKLPGKIVDLLSKNSNFDLVRWYVPPRLLSYLWGNIKLRKMIPKPTSNVDVFVSSDWAQPPRSIAKRHITIVHDLIFKKYPHTVDPVILAAQLKRLGNVSNECDLIFCDSKSTMCDLEHYYPQTSSRSVVNYPGVEPVSDAILPKFDYSFSPKKYFLSVGKLEPRKNIPFLIDSFCDFVAMPGMQEYELVIVGPKGWDVSEQNLARDGVHFLGKVSDEELHLLYHNSAGFVYPTLYEGFGIPPLEAMHAGCPVILSYTSSLIEIADSQSAVFVDPNSKSELVGAFAEFTTNHPKVKSLIKYGFENVKKFSWQSYTDKFIAEVEKMQI